MPERSNLFESHWSNQWLTQNRVTHAVDRSLETYLEKEGLGKNIALRERIAVCVSSSPAAQYLIARAARMAQRIEAELYVLYIY